MKISNAARTAMMTALAALLEAGAGGRIEFFTGAAPTNTTDTDSGTKLATCLLSDPCMASVSNGVGTFDAIADDSSVDATGTCGHWRAKANDGTVIAQGSVGTSGADINFNSLSFVSGGRCSITSLVWTQPAT